MAKRPTPIERAIAGEPVDRKARYEKRLVDRGFRRTTVTIPVHKHDELVALCARWREEHEARHDD